MNLEVRKPFQKDLFSVMAEEFLLVVASEQGGGQGGCSCPSCVLLLLTITALQNVLSQITCLSGGEGE